MTIPDHIVALALLAIDDPDAVQVLEDAMIEDGLDFWSALPLEEPDRTTRLLLGLEIAAEEEARAMPGAWTRRGDWRPFNLDAARAAYRERWERMRGPYPEVYAARGGPLHKQIKRFPYSKQVEWARMLDDNQVEWACMLSNNRQGTNPRRIAAVGLTQHWGASMWPVAERCWVETDSILFGGLRRHIPTLSIPPARPPHLSPHRPPPLPTDAPSYRHAPPPRRVCSECGYSDGIENHLDGSAKCHRCGEVYEA